MRMSHSIKVNDENYNRLLELEGKRETFNDIISRLIRVYDTLFSVKDILGPSHPIAAGHGPGSQDEKAPD